jgi:hypothetical protein
MFITTINAMPGEKHATLAKLRLRSETLRAQYHIIIEQWVRLSNEKDSLELAVSKTNDAIRKLESELPHMDKTV